MLVDYRVRQREYLLAISRALTSELDLADVLRIIVQASVEFISGRAGAIVLADPNDGSFRVAAIFRRRIPSRIWTRRWRRANPLPPRAPALPAQRPHG